MSKEKPKKKVEVSTILPRNPVCDYVQPVLHKIATEIVVDDSGFIPQYQDGSSAYVDLISSSPTVKLAHRGIATIDCGFTMKLPSGYKAIITTNAELANKGLMVATGYYQGRVKVVVINQGREIIVINHGDRFAQMCLEPVYLFDWILSGGDGFGKSIDKRG
jgi:dUTPase